MSVTERRCEPGSKTLDAACERHADHYWCPWCEGFYGVPHTDEFGGGGCHSQPDPRCGREDPRQCACRFCRILDEHGWDAALAFRNTQAARAKGGQLALDPPPPPERLGPRTFLRVPVEFADTAWEHVVGMLRDTGRADAIGVAARIDAQLQRARRSDAAAVPTAPSQRRRWRRPR